MRFASFNVNGIRAILKKDFEKSFAALNADFVVLEESKYSEDLHLDFPFMPEGYHTYWTVSKVRKGYSGVVIYAKEEPLSVHYGLEDEKYDEEGRIITLEYPSFYLVGAYVPNSGDGLKRLGERQEWDKCYADYLAELDRKKPVIACGDFNVAHKEIDLAHPENNHMSAGFTDEERAGFTNLLEKGFTDTFRYIHGDVKNAYSWWAQRIRTSKINNSGWRIDYFLVSDRIKDQVKRSEMVDSGPRQDHAPILLEIDM